MTGKEKTKYRQSQQWKKYRIEKLKSENYTCQLCGIRRKKGLNIHHLNDNTYGREALSDTVVLCPACHKLVERLLSRTRNPVDIELFSENLKTIYLKSK